MLRTTVGVIATGLFIGCSIALVLQSSWWLLALLVVWVIGCLFAVALARVGDAIDMVERDEVRRSKGPWASRGDCHCL